MGGIISYFFGPTLVDFYHYTSETAVDSIIRTGMIRESSDGGPDAMYGTGVYGTALPPTAGKRAIAYNNWTGGWEQRERGGSVEYVFKIRVPENSVLEFKLPNRHLYLHEGAIRLNNYEWQLFKV